MNIKLYTASFPFPEGFEDTFLLPEIPYISDCVDKLQICPSNMNGEAVDLSSYKNIHIDTTYVKNPYPSIATVFFFMRYLPVLLCECFRVFRPKQYLSILKEVIRYYTRAIVKITHMSQQEDAKRVLHYTYWFDSTTLALCMLKKPLIISRAHGFDLYEERCSFSFIPFREYCLKRAKRIYLVSMAGFEYLSSKYPKYKNKFNVSPIGTFDPGYITKKSEDGKIRLLSCSNIIPLKRVEMIVDVIAEMLVLHPASNIEWTHIGQGDGYSEIIKKAEILPEDKVKVRLVGRYNKDEVSQYYRNNQVDLFLHLSSTEGGRPIAICEALSYGVPVIAAAVGGVVELVSDVNGKLLESNPPAITVAKAIFKILKSDNYDRLKYGSKQVFWENGNADKNMREFVESLKFV